jgi:zona occludens toxin (predicted ATPase)
MTAKADINRWSTLPEGQFFDRKSAFDRSGSRHKQRKASDIAWDIVETLSAIANVLHQVRAAEPLTNQRVRNALGINRITAARYLRRWAESGWLRPVKKGRGSQYEPTPQLNVSLSKCIKNR